ncbi:Atxe2 family lasso peptide isopeptidase [Luteimonas sp. RD2P54]|uniref:Atxe2 family lasso peptide isopeptidase n=1 Tax=Luteimonas endophytica TaxID=3042023 RepID=A0ABT6J7A0_9GAMM|nr:Atxe2 family lasso peptide isopeptidase [Luteimonas endophytica]MDH5822707.1 Atxe2 family lasso peptide isopeptidase [Luteimonas endophytica]
MALGAASCLLCCLAYGQTVSPRALVEVVDIANPVVSPDGSAVAYRTEKASIVRNTYDTVWYVQGLAATGPPRPVADGGVPLRDSAGDSLPALPVWSPDGRWIYYRALVDGRVDVWRAATDGSGSEAVTADPADVREFRLEDEGRRLVYAVGATREEIARAEQDEYDGGIRVTATTPVGQNLFRSGNTSGRLATQRLGAWFTRVPLLSEVPERWRAIDLATGRTLEVSPPEPRDTPPAQLRFQGEDLETLRVSRDAPGRRLAVLARVGDRDPDIIGHSEAGLFVLSGDGRTPSIRCTDVACSGRPITSLQWRPQHSELLFTTTDRDEGLAQAIFRWDVKSGSVGRVVAWDGQLNGGARWAPSDCGVSATALVCVTASAGQPPRLELIHLDTGDRRVLFDPNDRLAQDVAAATRVRLLKWEDAEGNRFTGRYYAPLSGSKPAPLFVTYYHCPGFVRGGVGDEWPLATFPQYGIAALCINAPPLRRDATARYGMAVSSIRSVVAMLASTGEVDPSRVGMGGLSFGTEATLWTVVHSDLVAAASVSSSGISVLYHTLGSLRGEDFLSTFRDLWQAGGYGESPERWKILSPALNLHRIRAPILMQLPEQEYTHSLDYAIPLVASRRADLYVFPHEPHLKFQPRHKLAIYLRNLDWFRFWLQGEEDPAAAKREQYMHWREMRASLAAGTAGEAAPEVPYP